jgi:hypothetical protein
LTPWLGRSFSAILVTVSRKNDSSEHIGGGGVSLSVGKPGAGNVKGVGTGAGSGPSNASESGDADGVSASVHHAEVDRASDGTSAVGVGVAVDASSGSDVCPGLLKFARDVSLHCDADGYMDVGAENNLNVMIWRHKSMGRT